MGILCVFMMSRTDVAFFAAGESVMNLTLMQRSRGIKKNYVMRN